MSVDLSQFKRQLIYQDQVTSAELADFIGQIREQHQKTKRTLSAIRWLMVLGFVGMVVFVVCSANQHNPLLFLLAAACGTLGVGAIFVIRRMKKHDFSSRRYELVQELSGMLRRDMPNDAQFKVTLDLAPRNDFRKKTNEQKVRGWDVTFYEDPWLCLEGQFADGTAFEISMLERFQARSKRARSSSGKTKFKSKSKSATVATVKLFPKRKKYANLDRVTDQTKELVRLPSWVHVKKVTSKPNALTIVAATCEDWDVRRQNPKTSFDGTEIPITMLLSLYQVLHSSKAQTSA